MRYAAKFGGGFISVVGGAQLHTDKGDHAENDSWVRRLSLDTQPEPALPVHILNRIFDTNLLIDAPPPSAKFIYLFIYLLGIQCLQKDGTWKKIKRNKCIFSLSKI